MKPLTLEETAIKEEMKEKCLAKRQYVDENAKAKFDMLCHLEDFEVQYWELQQENKKLNGAIQTYDILLKANTEENKRLKDNWNELKKFIVKEYYMYLPLEASTKSITILINKMQELEESDE